MNEVGMLFSVITVVTTVTVFVLMFMSVKNLYEYTGIVPDMWKRMLVGTMFLAVSEFYALYKLIYQHSAYYLDFFTQIFEVVGATFLLLGLIPYLEEVTGE